MNKMTILLVVCILTATLNIPPVLAQIAAKDRRIEEEKRESLRITEPRRYDTPRPVYGTEETDEVTFFTTLLSQRLVYCRDAYQTLIILLGVEERYTRTDAQIAFLKKQGVIPPDALDGFDPAEPLRKGTAAYMFYRALGLRGGLWLRLFGMSQRYALKELVFEEIMMPGSTRAIVTGEELVLMTTRAADYLAEKESPPR